MKVTYTIGSLGLGGKERQLYYLLKYLPNNYKKQLIIFEDEHYFFKIDRYVDDIIVIPRSDKYSINSIIGLYKKIYRFGPDIIHSWDSVSPLLLKPLALVKNIKLLNGSFRTSGPVLNERKRKAMSRLLLLISDYTITNSLACLESLGISGYPKVSCIYNGFDIIQFDKLINRKTDFVKKNTYRICMVARFCEPKDYDTLIEVALKMMTQSIDVEFLLVGEGPNKSNIKLKVKKLDLRNVYFLGNRSDIPYILSTCDVGLLLNPKNRSEGMPNVIMEYMAAELPVIATNAGGNRELITDEVSGYLVNAEDSSEIVDRLRKLINNKKRGEMMGLNGRKQIEHHFQMSTMINKYENLYHKIID